MTLTERITIVAFACVITIMVLLAAYFTNNRGGDVDELGLYNPSYMVARFGTLTYPIYGYFDKPVIVHPPVHVGLIGVLSRLGLTWYYAEGTPVAFFLLLTVWLIVRERFTPPVKLGLLFGTGFLIATNPVFINLFGTRPEGGVHAIWIAALVLLESGRLAGWSPRHLFAGAFLLAWASAVHYYATPAVLGAGVYLIWAIRSRGWAKARPQVLALLGGGLLFGLPYLGFYVIPYGRDVVQAASEQVMKGSPISLHFATYHNWAINSSVPGLLRTVCKLGVPPIVVSTALLAAIPGTRGIAMSSLPLQLGIFFFARHQPSIYLNHEAQLFATSVALGLVSLAYWGALRLHVPSWCRGAVLATAAILLCTYLYRTDVYPYPVISTAPEVHDGDVARAATLQVVGPNASVASRLGLWYAAGGANWHELLYDLTYDKSADPAGYFSHFDIIADNSFRSGESPKDTRRTPSYWYSTGVLKLRGFYISDTDDELRMVLLSPKQPTKVTGYVLQAGNLFRFDEAPSGKHEVTTATCPAAGGFRYVELTRRFPSASMVVLDLPPAPSAPPSVILTVLSPLASPELTGLLAQSCVVSRQTRGELSSVNKDSLVDRMRRGDTPIHVYPYKVFPAPKG